MVQSILKTFSFLILCVILGCNPNQPNDSENPTNPKVPNKSTNKVTLDIEKIKPVTEPISIASNSEIDSLVSPNRKFKLIFQKSDGNVALYNSTNKALWHTATNNQNAKKFVMQNDGNLCIYDNTNKPIWQSFTSGITNAKIQLQDDGNLVIYNAKNIAYWATMTTDTITCQNRYGWKLIDFMPRQFPLKLTDGTDFGSFHMTTSVTISKDGSLDAITTIDEHTHLRGDCGKSAIWLLDEDGNVLQRIGGLQYCVDGKSVPFGGPSHRDEHWGAKVEPSILDKVRGISIFHSNGSKNPLDLLTENYEEAKRKLKPIGEDIANAQSGGQ